MAAAAADAEAAHAPAPAPAALATPHALATQAAAPFTRAAAHYEGAPLGCSSAWSSAASGDPLDDTYSDAASSCSSSLGLLRAVPGIDPMTDPDHQAPDAPARCGGRRPEQDSGGACGRAGRLELDARGRRAMPAMEDRSPGERLSTRIGAAIQAGMLPLGNDTQVQTFTGRPPDVAGQRDLLEKASLGIAGGGSGAADRRRALDGGSVVEGAQPGTTGQSSLLEQASLGIAQDSGCENGMWSNGPGMALWLAGASYTIFQ